MDCVHFRLGRNRYALALEAVGGVTSFQAPRRIPSAPRAILGVAECRGEVVTVIDLPWLLDESAGAGEPSLLTLCGAFSTAALYVPAKLAVSQGEPARAADGATRDMFQPMNVQIAGEPHRLLSPAGIVAAAQSRS